jgi:hypothetical protein
VTVTAADGYLLDDTGMLREMLYRSGERSQPVPDCPYTPLRDLQPAREVA